MINRPSDRALFAWMFLLSAVVWGIALRNPYYYDDAVVLADNAWIRGGNPFVWFRSFYIDSNHIFTGFRPILMLSFWLDRFLWGEGPLSFRIGNIFLHTLNAFLLVQIVKKWFEDPSKTIVPFAAGFLFLFHPVQTIAINFLWKRSSILETTLIFASVLLYLRKELPSKWTYALQLILFALALLTKESAIMLPVFLLALDFFRGKKQNWTLLTGMAGIGAVFIWLRLFEMSRFMAEHVDVLSGERLVNREVYFYTALSAIPKYLQLFLIPAPRIADDPVPIQVFPWGSVTFCLLGIAFSVYASLRWKRKSGFWLVLFWLSFVPTLGYIPLYLAMDQIRMYLPIAALSVLFAVTVDSILKKHVAFVFVAITCGYLASTVIENLAYRNPITTWTEVVQEYPQSDLAWNHLGSAFHEAGRYKEAVIAFTEAGRLKPLDPSFEVNALYNRYLSGTPQSLLKHDISAISPNRLSAQDRVNLAILSAEIGDPHRAEKILLDLIARQPTYGLAHLNLAILWDRLEKKENAKRAYANALMLMPNNARAKEGMLRLGRP